MIFIHIYFVKCTYFYFEKSSTANEQFLLSFYALTCNLLSYCLHLSQMFWSTFSSSFLGSDLAGEAAAALAASSIVFRNVDSEYSAKCLQHAQDLYRFADTYRGFYHKAIPGGQEYYESADYGDELAWAAAWLYNATAESKYLHDAVQHYQHFHLDERPNTFFYNKKTAGVQVREFTPYVGSKYGSNGNYDRSDGSDTSDWKQNKKRHFILLFFSRMSLVRLALRSR